MSATELIVFADDWGRHPSSSQHLVRHLLSRYTVTWVNTIGTRRVRVSREDVGKGVRKLASWVRRPADSAQTDRGLVRVLSPLMYPGFRTRWQRGINARLIARSIARSIAPVAPPRPGVRRVVLTTLPITADLIGRLDADRWVYYCVDDYSVWPGVDGDVMDAMERQLVERVDAAVAVSDTLVARLASMGRRAEMITHGLDLDHWQAATDPVSRGGAVFWGVVDRRLSTAFCRAAAEAAGGLTLIGPTQSPDPALASFATLAGPMAYAALPQVAAGAAVLVMPYADLPVTRAIQPLKLKEYLATGRPVVSTALPAVMPWSRACDVAEDAAQWSAAVRRAVREGVTAEQRAAREPLAGETWASKAAALERVLNG